MKYKSIFVSDIHLGTKFSQADRFLDFIKHNESENLYLVGDIIDGWAIKRKFRWEQSHSDVIQKILRKARKGTNIYFITGNHDEFLRPFIPILLGDSLTILNEAQYYGADGKRYYVTHGDFFDSITLTKKWLAVLGDIGYDLLLNLNQTVNFIRKQFGFYRYWSLSKYVKDNVKQSVSFITDFETILAEHAKNQKYDGIICGHIHKAEMKDIDGIAYKNSGDWVESCTALVETFDGEWKIIDWLKNED
ncbi:MAG TPA: UDP-2,3-diacylglucosamine diphosphatase [Campylobacterales bacterium]|nr:UDP-2,3-diacylglucosamine diphosphatase [Campylobacterales bacterium]HHD80857.1 UDP-2,3-diacylglucosamine diphosphatase [Campylobacterales bacterium]HHH52003.1 UDP-2,3-diacylglucosamine diphosphatase [Campylobacterales bacterium]